MEHRTETELIREDTVAAEVSAEGLALAELAYPDSEFAHPATNLAFREAFLRGFQAHASATAARQPSEDDREVIAKALCEGAGLQWNDLDEQERAAVPDAATEVLDAHRCDESAERAYKRTIRAEAERDAALAAIDRVRAEMVGIDSAGRSGLSRADLIAALKKLLYRYGPGSEPQRYALGQALAALDETPEPEWEYAVALAHDLIAEPRYPSAEAATSAAREWPMTARSVRRRKAGPWLPVEGESK